MSSGQRRRTHIDVGSYVQVCADSMEFILEDMALLDEDDGLLRGIQMYDTVKSKSRNSFLVELPAAEASEQTFPKGEGKVG